MPGADFGSPASYDIGVSERGVRYHVGVTTVDRRVRRTRAALAESLLTLAAQRPFAALTVRDLAAHAGIGYATFFRHYRNKEDLLLDVVGGIVDELADALTPGAGAGRVEETAADLFAYVDAQAPRLRVLFAALAGTPVEAALRAAIGERVRRSRTLAERPGLPADLAAHHVAIASLGLITWWLEHGHGLDRPRMAAAYADWVIRPLLAG